MDVLSYSGSNPAIPTRGIGLGVSIKNHPLTLIGLRVATCLLFTFTYLAQELKQMSKRLKRWIDSAEKWYEEYKPFFVFFTAFGNASLVVFRIILFICER